VCRAGVKLSSVCVETLSLFSHVGVNQHLSDGHHLIIMWTQHTHKYGMHLCQRPHTHTRATVMQTNKHHRYIYCVFIRRQIIYCVFIRRQIINTQICFSVYTRTVGGSIESCETSRLKIVIERRNLTIFFKVREEHVQIIKPN